MANQTQDETKPASPGMDADQFRAAAHAVIEESEHTIPIYPLTNSNMK